MCIIPASEVSIQSSKTGHAPLPFGPLEGICLQAPPPFALFPICTQANRARIVHCRSRNIVLYEKAYLLFKDRNLSIIYYLN